MPDVRHPRRTRCRADRGLDQAIHRTAMRRPRADDRRRPAPPAQGRRGGSRSSRISIAALGKSRKLARGPKPGRALREIGLEPQATTEKPTSEGIAEMLARLDLGGHRVGLQLYPDKDHGKLIGAIAAQGAEVDPVLPYVYDAQAAAEQYHRRDRRDGAGPPRCHCVDELGPGPPPDRGCQGARLRSTAARGAGTGPRSPSVGPVVSDELAAHGLRAEIAPANGAHFMKPLITAMAAALRQDAATRGETVADRSRSGPLACSRK